MGIKTVRHPPYSPDVGPCDFWLFPKLRGCRYETIEEMKETVTKVIDTLTQEDFHGALQKLLERYKCIAAGGDYFEWDKSFMCVLSIKVPIRKKPGNLFNDPRISGLFNKIKLMIEGVDSTFLSRTLGDVRWNTGLNISSVWKFERVSRKQIISVLEESTSQRVSYRSSTDR